MFKTSLIAPKYIFNTLQDGLSEVTNNPIDFISIDGSVCDALEVVNIIFINGYTLEIKLENLDYDYLDFPENLMSLENEQYSIKNSKTTIIDTPNNIYGDHAIELILHLYSRKRNEKKDLTFTWVGVVSEGLV